MASLVALLGAPQGSLALDAPSPKGSLDGEVSAGGAGEPHASSVLAGAAALWVHRSDRVKPDTTSSRIYFLKFGGFLCTNES